MPVKSSGVLFDRRAQETWPASPNPAPVAILSQPYQGRDGLRELRLLRIFWLRDARQVEHVSKSVIPLAEKTGHCEIRPNSSRAYDQN